LLLEQKILLLRLQALSQRERDGFVIYVEQQGTQQLVKVLHDMLFPPPQTSVSSATPIPVSALGKANKERSPFGILEKLLDSYTLPITQSALGKQLENMSRKVQTAWLADMKSSGIENQSEVLALAGAYLKLIRHATSPTRLELWEAWRPGQTFDPERLRNHLTILHNHLRGHSATIQQTDLYAWLSKLDKGEKKEFSGFFSTFGDDRRKDLAQFLDAFMKHAFKRKPLNKKAFFSLWKGSSVPYDKDLIDKHNHYILKRLKEFFAVKELLLQPLEVTQKTIQNLSRRGCPAQHEKERRDAERALEKAPIDNVYLEHALFLEDARLFDQFGRNRSTANTPSFSKVNQLNAELFLLRAIRYGLSEINFERSIGNDGATSSLPHTISAIESTGNRLSPYVKANLCVWKMLKGSVAADELVEFLAFLHNESANLPKAYQTEFTMYLINFLGLEIRDGFLGVRTLLKNVYQVALERGTLLVNGALPIPMLKNIVVTFVREGHYDDADSVFRQHKPLSPTPAEAITVKYIEAILLQEKGELRAARKIFNAMVYGSDDVFFNTDARLRILIITFQLREFMPEQLSANQSPFEIELSRFNAFSRDSDKHAAPVADGITLFVGLIRRMYNIEKPNTIKRACTAWQAIKEELVSPENRHTVHWEALIKLADEALMRHKCIRTPSASSTIFYSTTSL
jgi:hypothetical protein